MKKLSQPIVLGNAEKNCRPIRRRYDIDLFKGSIDGKAKEFGGLVERRCEKLADFCERKTFRHSGGQEASSYPWGRRAEGYETRSEVPVDQTEISVALPT
jgi:hypothetical protein